MRKRPVLRRGAAVVELAALAPVLFLLIFGMIEIGRAVMVQHLLTNAARDGARAAVLEGATASSVSSDVTSYLTSAAVSRVTVTINPSDLSTAAGGSPVTVSASVPFSAVSWLPAPWFMGSATLDASVTMRREVYTSSSP